MVLLMPQLSGDVLNYRKDEKIKKIDNAINIVKGEV